jgi:hypothetical protein
MSYLPVPYALADVGGTFYTEALVETNASDKLAIANMRASAVNDRMSGIVRWACPFCGLALYPHKGGTVHWQHFPNSHNETFCIYGTGTSLTKDQLEGMVYRGRQVGARHEEIAGCLVKLLEADESVEKLSVTTDEYMTPISVNDHGRYPDVCCKLKNGKSIVFEVQTSPIFLYRIVEREKFYKKQNACLIWVTDDLKMAERLPAYVYDFLAIQGSAAFDLPKQLYEQSLSERKFRLRRTLNLGTTSKLAVSTIELSELLDQKSILAKNWINRRPSFPIHNIPMDFTDEFLRLAAGDQNYQEFDAARLCDWLLSIETGVLVGYDNVNLLGMINAALCSDFGNQISHLMLRAISEFQPELLEKKWIERKVAESTKYCEVHELHQYGRNSWVEKLRKKLFPAWVLPDHKKISNLIVN